MRDSRSSRGMQRKLRLAAAILGAAIALPGLAVADHTTCTGPGAGGCPIFNPGMIMGPEMAFTDTPSGIGFRYGLTDHTMPVLEATYLLPKGWQFAVSSVRPANVPAGTHEAQCNDAYSGEENDADDQAATLGEAENLAGGVGMTVTDEYHRNNFLDPMKFGYTPGSRSNSALPFFPPDFTSREPSLAFLNWNPTTKVARMCLYLYANDGTVGSYDEMGMSGDADPLKVDDTDSIQAAREYMIPVTLTQLTSDPEFGWAIDFSMTQLYANNDHIFTQTQATVLDQLFYINSLSGGNWNINPVTGKKEYATFSTSPVNPGDYKFRAVMKTCAESIDDTHTAGDTHSTVCTNDNLFSKVIDKIVRITPPPGNILRDFGVLTGPAGGGAPLAGTRWGVVRGTTNVTIPWNQPPKNPALGIRGYELAVGIPGDLNSRHIERIITDTALPLQFDTRAPCGATGNDASCSVTLSFPLAGLSGDLGREGKYDISLVTIYKDGTRTDGRCDNGLPQGVQCPASQAAFQVAPPGSSTWSFFITHRDYPVAFAEVSTYNQTGATAGTPGGVTRKVPFYLLLVNFATKQGLFVDTHPYGGAADVYFAPSNQIIGDNASGHGAIAFGSGTVAGATTNFRFDGQTLIGANLDITIAPLSAGGVFTLYNVKGAPATAGLPDAFIHDFVGEFIS